MFLFRLRGLASSIAGVALVSAALAAPPYFEGFEDAGFSAGGPVVLGSQNWNRYNSLGFDRVPSGTGGILSKSGGFHAVIDSTAVAAPPDDWTGAFTRLGGYSSIFGGGFRASVSVYIDLADPAVVANTYGWDLSTAASNQSGGHRRDFIFHTASNAMGQVLVGASNNSNFTRRNDIGSINHYTITASGWYTFEWVFRNNAGVLAVDCNLRNASGVWLWTETRSDASDLIATVVGGNRYMWFTFLEVDTLAIDDTSLVLGTPGGMPVDLNGEYCVPFTDDWFLFPAGVIAGTGNAWAPFYPGEGRVIEDIYGTLAQDGSNTPFAEGAGKAPNFLEIADFRGKSYSFDIDMGSLGDWLETDLVDFEPSAGAFVDQFDPAGYWGSLAYVVKNGGVYKVLGYDYTLSAYVVVYTAAPDETMFRITTVRDAAGTTYTHTVTPLDGANAGSAGAPVVVDAVGTADLDLSFYVSGSQYSPDDSDRKASKFTISNFVTDAVPNALYAYADDPYVKTTETIDYRMGMANLAQLTGGYQAYLSSSGVQTFGSGAYTGLPFIFAVGGPAYNPISSSLWTARGIAPGGLPVQLDATLVNFVFNPTGQGLAGLAINANNGFGLDTVFADDGTLGNTYAPNRFGSNAVIVDDTVPSITSLSAMQGVHNVITSSLIKQGTMLVCAEIKDNVAGSGLDCYPTLTVDFTAQPDITVTLLPLIGNLYCAEVVIPPTQPCDTAVLRLSATDKAGNTQNTASGALDVNTVQVTLSIAHAAGFEDSGQLSVVRGMEIRLGGTGGSNAPIVLDRDVVLDPVLGTAIVVLDASDGIPCDADITRVSVKDPLHTLRDTVALVSVGNQHTGSVSLLGGNLNKDNKIDIGDYVVFAVRFGGLPGPDTPYPHLPAFRHADVNGDGEVTIGDYAILSFYWGVLDDADVGNYRGGNTEIRTRIAIGDAIAEAGPEAAKLDRDGDGWITMKELGF